LWQDALPLSRLTTALSSIIDHLALIERTGRGRVLMCGLRTGCNDQCKMINEATIRYPA
jgi:hypothetical protein